VGKVFAVSLDQKKLFNGLGLAQVDVAGSLKWTAPPLTVDEGVLERKGEFFKGRRVCVAASTHPGEETFWLAVFKELRALYPVTLLILVPRHVHRAPLIVSQVQAEGLSAALESFQEGENSLAVPDVLVVDRMGLLGLCYRLAEVAFVGGSLIPGIGGHTLIEPLVLGVPVVHGPHMAKQAQVQDHLDHKGITHCVQTVNECVTAVSRWLEDDILRARIAHAGREEVALQREKVLTIYRQGLESLGMTTVGMGTDREGRAGE
jgi:3-deoxy-D-manno-octulosonic-acid transferase